MTQIHEITRSVAECCSRSQNFTFVRNPALSLSTDTNSLELDTRRDGVASARAGSRFPSTAAYVGSVRQPPGELHPPPAPSHAAVPRDASFAHPLRGSPWGRLLSKSWRRCFQESLMPPGLTSPSSGQTGLCRPGMGVTTLAWVCETGTLSWQPWSPWLVMPCAGMAAFVPCHPARGWHAPQSVAHSSLQGGPCCVGGWRALGVTRYRH